MKEVLSATTRRTQPLVKDWQASSLTPCNDFSCRSLVYADIATMALARSLNKIENSNNNNNIENSGVS